MESILPSIRRPRPLQPAPRHSLTETSYGRNTSLIRSHPLLPNWTPRFDILVSPSKLQLSRHLINGNSVIKVNYKRIPTKILFKCCVINSSVVESLRSVWRCYMSEISELRILHVLALYGDNFYRQVCNVLSSHPQ